jgi:NAD(P)-dependent dehydrogenase (short-subunit alcohol dehydrogenase family)
LNDQKGLKEMLLTNKRIIVVGGASGMGAAMVRAFIKENGRVVSMDINAEQGAKIVHALDSESAHFVQCDVTNRASVFEAFEKAAELLGGVDVVACPAAIEQAVPPEDVTEVDLDRMYNTNIKGTVFVNQAAFEHMRQHGGAIINFGSSAGLDGSPLQGAYSAAKGAVLAWTRAVARRWGPFGIRANAVCPMIMTPMAAQYLASLTPDQRAAYDDRIGRTITLGGKLGDPDTDFAPAMVFLASDYSRFITGQTIPVDGGHRMMT